LKLRIHLFILLAALALARPAAAESPFIVDVWGTADGLPQSSVIALTQTRDGYLWLGTLNGLVRFDGNSFTRFNVNNTPGLPGDKIVFLFEDSRTNLWVGTEPSGLCLINNGQVQNFDTSGGGGKVTCAYEDAVGAIWFSTTAGRVFCWHQGRLDVRPSSFPPTLPLLLLNRSVHSYVPAKDGAHWQLQNGRVTQWRDDKLVRDFGVTPWKGAFVPAAFPGRMGFTFDGSVNAVAVDDTGNLAVGTLDDGVFWLDATGLWQHLSTGQGLSYTTVLSLCFDREGNLWVGTDGGGLDRVKRRVFTTSAELRAGVAQSAAEDAAGGLWAAFNRGGLSYVLTNATDFRVGDKNNAWSVLVDRQQRVWAGTRDQDLFLFTGGRFQHVDETARIGPQIFALFESRLGTVWAGGINGLGSFDGQAWKFYSTRDGLPAKAVRALAEDAAGNLWIGTEGGGLFSLRAGKIDPVTAPVKDISCLLADRNEVLWVGTSSHGLAWLAQGRWTRCSSLNGLAADDIGYLIEDDATNLWLGTYEGLLRVEKSSLASFAADTNKSVACRTFLTRECFAGAQPAALRTRAGKMWFPTIEGLVSVNPAELKTSQQPPPVVIESVAVDGVELKANPLSSVWPETVTLTPKNEQLEIHFTALNFSAPKNARSGARFKYRLTEAGHEKSWTDAGVERVAHFPKLPPGQYVFHVTACNEDGVWSRLGATLAVTVQPPFWRTRSFLITATLGLLGILAGTIYLISTAKLKRQLRALHQKELIEKERARIARDLHDQLGANLTQVTLLGEMAEIDKDLPDEVEQHAQQICATARETTRSLDEIVWAVNPSNDTLEGLANYACKYAQDYFALAGVSYRAELPTQLPPTPILPEVRHNVFLAFKEAVNNVVKHAQATEAHVCLQLEPDKFILSVTDNGRGLGDLSAKKLRNGLKNMRKRLADVQGEFDITPGANGGTVVRLTVPVASQQAEK